LLTEHALKSAVAPHFKRHSLGMMQQEENDQLQVPHSPCQWNIYMCSQNCWYQSHSIHLSQFCVLCYCKQGPKI